MTIRLRDWQRSDLPFLRQMLYEAVFWRPNPNKPSFEEGSAYPEVSKALIDWGERAGDTAIIATINAMPIGAAWYRYFTDDNFINGYVDAKIPVIVIGVHHAYRRQGVGKSMMAGLIASAAKQSIPQLSLSVSKDNVAIHLYRQQGFVEYADKGDAFLMVREL